MALKSAHKGYEYQDLLIAARLVDVMLGSIDVAKVDMKLVKGDRFDDLATVNNCGSRERIQIKHTDNSNQTLSLVTFTNDNRNLRLDKLILAALADRVEPGSEDNKTIFRIIMCDVPGDDTRLATVLELANPDPGSFLPGMESKRYRFSPKALWEGPAILPGELQSMPKPFAFLQEGDQAIERTDLEWVCKRLVVELAAPDMSSDLTNPAAAERLLLKRVQEEVGAGIYPNKERSVVDVAESLIHSARAARQGLQPINASELLRRSQLRSDFGAVGRSCPVDEKIEVARASTVAELVRQTTTAANEGSKLLLLGPPGQGKSWICKQLVDSLHENDWLVAEHYCYLGDADGERIPRVLTETIFGSLIERIAEYDPKLVTKQRPRFAADEHLLTNTIGTALREQPDRRVALVVDGIDRVSRVIPIKSTVSIRQ